MSRRRAAGRPSSPEVFSEPLELRRYVQILQRIGSRLQIPAARSLRFCRRGDAASNSN